MKKSLAIGILVLLFIGLGFGIWKMQNRVPRVTDNSANSEVASTREFKTDNGLTFSLPTEWTGKKNPYEFISSTQVYEIAVAPNEALVLQTIDVTEWLKGPGPDEGYVLPIEQRQNVADILRQVYDHKDVTKDDAMDFAAQAGEFFGYNRDHRIDLHYLASKNNDWRGLTFMNTMGQDVGVWPIYYVVLFNKTTNQVVAGYYDLGNAEEVLTLNKKLDYDASPEEMSKVDNALHEEFADLIYEGSRSNTSFGGILNQIDQFMQSVR